MDGFLPFSRGSFMLDTVAVAMVAVVPLLSASLYLVTRRRAYAAHRAIQLGLGIVLLVTVVAFELEMRFYGWRHLAEPSPYYDGILFPFLYVHVAIASVTTVAWALTLVQALRRFPRPPRPGLHSATHRRWGMFAAIMMYVTAITGWLFYAMAFVAG